MQRPKIWYKRPSENSDDQWQSAAFNGVDLMRSPSSGEEMPAR